MKVNKLRDLIDGKKITKAKVIKSAGISRPALDAILEGKDFKVSNLEKIASVLGVKVGYFFDEDIEVKEEFNQFGNNNIQARKFVGVKPKEIVSTDNCSPDTLRELEKENQHLRELLAERVKSLEALVAEKDERITELKERIEELKDKM